MVAQFSGKRRIGGGTAGIQHYLWAGMAGGGGGQSWVIFGQDSKMTYVSYHLRKVTGVHVRVVPHKMCHVVMLPKLCTYRDGIVSRYPRHCPNYHDDQFIIIIVHVGG